MLVLLNALRAWLLSQGLFQLTSESPITAAAPENPMYRPSDPSTLTLALIGAGTLAIYLAYSRARRPNPVVEIRGTNREIAFGLPDESVRAETERPSRGAA